MQNNIGIYCPFGTHLALTWRSHLAHLARSPPGTPGEKLTWRLVFVPQNMKFITSTWRRGAHLARGPPGILCLAPFFKAPVIRSSVRLLIPGHLARSPPGTPGEKPTWRPPGAQVTWISGATWPPGPPGADFTWREMCLPGESLTWRFHLAKLPPGPPGHLAVMKCELN